MNAENGGKYRNAKYIEFGKTTQRGKKGHIT